jgi:hypothetical protein
MVIGLMPSPKSNIAFCSMSIVSFASRHWRFVKRMTSFLSASRTTSSASILPRSVEKLPGNEALLSVISGL